METRPQTAPGLIHALQVNKGPASDGSGVNETYPVARQSQNG